MTASYLSMKGFNSLSDTDLLTSVQSNFISFVDWGFLDKGGFTNVYLSQGDIRSNNRSNLRQITDQNYQTGQVWSTFRQNLVWESGLSTSQQPVQISGVYVDGSFKTPSTPGYEHYVDYIGGRVVFNSGISATQVSMEYSYKNVLITQAESPGIIPELQHNSYNLSDSNYPTSTSGDWSTLERARVQLPVVTVEVSPNVGYSPYELGSLTQLNTIDVLFYVYDQKPSTCRKLSYFIGTQYGKTIFLYDIDSVASSGEFPIDHRGAKQSSPLTYPHLISNFAYNKLYIVDSNIQGPYRIGDIYHSIVKLKTQLISLL